MKCEVDSLEERSASAIYLDAIPIPNKRESIASPPARCRQAREEISLDDGLHAMLDNTHGHAAIDGQVFSGDKVILHQLQDCAGYILRFAFAMERNPIFDIVLHLFRREDVLEGSANDPWRDAIHADIVVCEFAREGARKLRQGPLHHSICQCAEAAAVAGCRTDEYDCAFPLLDHVRHRGASQSQYGMHMDIEGLEPALFGHLEESAGDCSAGRMNQNIEAPLTGNRFGNGADAILSDAASD